MDIVIYISTWLQSLFRYVTPRKQIMPVITENKIEINNIIVDDNIMTNEVESNIVVDNDDDFEIIDPNFFENIPIIYSDYIDVAINYYDYPKFILKRCHNYGIISIYMVMNPQNINKVFIDLYIYQDDDNVYIYYDNNKYKWNKLYNVISGPDDKICCHFKTKPHYI